MLRCLLEKIPTLIPMTMACVVRDSLHLLNTDCRVELEKALEQLVKRYKLTYDLCILQTTTLIRVIFI